MSEQRITTESIEHVLQSWQGWPDENATVLIRSFRDLLAARRELEAKDREIERLRADLRQRPALPCVGEARSRMLQALDCGTVNEALEKIAAERAAREQAERELERYLVQLAGCGVAASGGTSVDHIAEPGSYGWSPAYQDVLDLRLRCDRVERELERLRDTVWPGREEKEPKP